MLPELIKSGLGKYLIKVMNRQGQELSFPPIQEIFDKEANVKDEIRLYDAALLESYTIVVQNEECE